MLQDGHKFVLDIDPTGPHAIRVHYGDMVYTVEFFDSFDKNNKLKMSVTREEIDPGDIRDICVTPDLTVTSQ